jgi:hypothetical protein
MVSLRRPQSFVVRVSRDTTGQLEGIVERPRTGQKGWFQGADQIGRLIAYMLDTEPAPAEARRDEEDS